MGAAGRWARRVGVVVGVVVLSAFTLWALRHFESADWSRYREPASVIGIALAALLWAAIIPMSAWAWRLLLADTGHCLGVPELIGILGISNLGKYLPGNVGHHAGRVTLALARGIPLPIVAATMASETLLALVAATTVGAIGVAFALTGVAPWENLSMSPARAAAWIFGGVTFALLIILAAREMLPRHWRQRLGICVPRPSTLAPVMAAYCGTFLSAGLGLVVLAYALFPNVPHDPQLLTGGFALSWLVGVITPGAPAGLGVREGVLAGFLVSTYSEADILILVLGFRLATTIGDLLSFCVGYYLAKIQ